MRKRKNKENIEKPNYNKIRELKTLLRKDDEHKEKFKSQHFKKYRFSTQILRDNDKSSSKKTNNFDKMVDYVLSTESTTRQSKSFYTDLCKKFNISKTKRRIFFTNIKGNQNYDIKSRIFSDYLGTEEKIKKIEPKIIENNNTVENRAIVEKINNTLSKKLTTRNVKDGSIDITKFMRGKTISPIKTNNTSSRNKIIHKITYSSIKPISETKDSVISQILKKSERIIGRKLLFNMINN